MQLCLEQFNSTRKMGGEAFSARFFDQLSQEISEAYESFLKRNESKHIMNAYRTPAVLVTIMAISYFISSILDMLGTESLSQTAIFGLYIPLLCVLVWCYVRYSGNFRELGQAIDNVTAVVWEHVSNHTVTHSVIFLTVVYQCTSLCSILCSVCRLCNRCMPS